MRFSAVFLFILVAIYGVFNNAAQAHINTSFGPEISAEDFHQHAHSLAEFKATKQQQAYLQLQFKRLGLISSALPCQPLLHGELTTLTGTEQSRTDSVVYFANLDDIYQIASVLEIAERFLTTKPRPEHTVYFIFSDNVPEALRQCTALNSAGLVIQPKDMEKLDASSLTRELNALQRQGK